MNNIEWKDGAVCFANGWQWFYDCAKIRLSNLHGCCLSYHNATLASDFQLNEPSQGDYIPKSELDTEQKYNDAVEVFGLFGYKPNSCFASYQDMYSEFSILIDDGKLYQESETYPPCKRKLTYNQLMTIGKLKRLMNERNNLKRWGEYSGCVAVNLGDVKTIGPCAGGFSVGYECNTSEKPNSCDKPKLATQYLNECIDVQKQRGEQYDSTGTGERSFAAAASAFNAITGKNLKGSDVCLLLTCVKAVRQYSNPNRLHEDSLLDGVSYLSLWAEELNKEIN